MENILCSNKSIVAISSYSMTPETEKLASEYDIVIRFNIGSNPKILKKYSFYNQKTDLCVLSGWTGKDGKYKSGFGPLDGFTNQNILFSRPKKQDNFTIKVYDIISIRPEFENNLAQYTNSIKYIPVEVFYELNQLYNYAHPTSGIIAIYYISKILSLNIDTINFSVNKFFNSFLGLDGNLSAHKIDIEQQILLDLNIKNIII